MANSNANPVNELQILYQRLKLPLPRYEFVDANCNVPACNPRFICNLFAQVEEAETNAPEEQVFQGEGSTKKIAKANAAEVALQMLRSTPMYQRASQLAAAVTPLWDTLEQLLSDEGLRKEPMLRPYVLWAQAYSPGAMLPLSALTHVRTVRGWLKARAPETPDDHHAMVHAIAARLLSARERRGPAAAASSIEVVGDAASGLGVRRTQHYALPGEVAGTGLVDDVESERPVLVLLPADVSLPPQEVRIDAGGDLLGKLSAVLRTDPAHLVTWGHMGHKVYYVATPEQLEAHKQRQQRQQEVLQDALLLQPQQEQEHEQHRRQQQQGQQEGGTQQEASGDEPPRKRRQLEAPTESEMATRQCSGPIVMDWDDQDPEVKGPAHVMQGAATAGAYEAHGGHVIKVAEPVLYSVTQSEAEAGPINQRASWIAGRPVRGNALLSLCRVSTAQRSGKHVVKWHDYTMEDYWRSASAVFPSAEYRRGVHAPLLSRLPHHYREPGSWSGTTPAKLLENYCKRYSWRCCQECTIERLDVSSKHHVRLVVVAFGSGAIVEVHAEHASAHVAQNQAALTMLHGLEQINAAGLLNCSLADWQQRQQQEQQRRPVGEARQLEVVAPGDGQLAPDKGLCAKVDAKLVIPAADLANGAPAGSPADDYVLEHRPALSFEIGCAAVMPALETAVMALKAKGVARCNVAVPLEGADPLNKFRPVACTLHVRLLSMSHPRAAGELPVLSGSGMALFDPPLSVQRYDFVTGLVQDSGARTVVDLGCGEGRLLAQLLRNCAFTSLQRITGIDTSESALRQASRRLERLVSVLPTMVELPPQHEADEQQQQQQQQQQQGQQLQQQSEQQASMLAGQGSAAPGTEASEAVAWQWDGEGPDAAPSRGEDASAAEPQVAELGRGAVVRGKGSSVLDRQASVHQAMLRTQSQALSSSSQAFAVPPAKRQRSPVLSSALSNAPGSLEVSEAASEEGPGGAAVWNAQVSLIQADFAGQGMTRPEAWGQLVGCDLAALMEVVEHLDPLPLGMTLPAVLGALRPKMAVVTTPNYEYNQVLRGADVLAAGPRTAPAAAEAFAEAVAVEPEAAGPGAAVALGGSGPDAGATAAGGHAAGGAAAGVQGGMPEAGQAAFAEPSTNSMAAETAAGATATTADSQRALRNSDHRFEWTRQEFRAWAGAAGRAFGYDVAFHDVGHALTEEDVVGSAHWAGSRDVGAASQAAVFTRISGEGATAGGLPAPFWGPKRLAVVVGGEGAGEDSAGVAQGQASGALQDEEVPVEHF